ncbi:MAG: hypothetical protein ACPLZD_05415 [Candidatus Saccharicenans sp.]|nr:MAG: hypothetical protein C0168_02525 [Candidatus Aminicenantes bacterium]HEK86022.1 hypothetical protein [Candidatus Aminicenantes bacterium]
MRKKSWPAAAFILAVFALMLFLTPSSSSGSNQEKRPSEEKSIQTPPDQAPPPEIQKPKLDYMSTFLSRNTSPLGLKEDQQAREMLKQSKTKWAIRAGLRHILN